MNLGGSLNLRKACAALLALVLSACASLPGGNAEFEASRATLSKHIRVLASEEFGGREPGTEGDRMSQQYIVDALASYGYEPGAPGGIWRQNIGLVRYSGGKPVLEFKQGRKRIELSGEGILLQAYAPRIRLEERGAVFVTSEAGLQPDSLAGQIALVRMEDYNSLLPKLREAGVAVAVILAEEQNNFDRLVARFADGRFGLVGGDPTRTGAVLVSPELTAKLVKGLGKSIAALSSEAETYQGPVLLDFTATLTSEQASENRDTANVIGLLPGKIRGSGSVVLMAHYDHLGICRRNDPRDNLCNGAIDNASGVGMMLEIARKIATQGPLDRDLFVVGLSSEELGLLGAESFVDDPPVPLPTIVAAFNLDTMAVAPKGSPLTVIGDGKTPLDAGVAEVAAKLGRTLDIRPEHQDFVQRQDGWVFLSRDVPAVVVSSWMGDSDAFQDYLTRHYHKPSDEWRPDLELGGATEDIMLHVELLNYFGNEATYRVGG